MKHSTALIRLSVVSLGAICLALAIGTHAQAQGVWTTQAPMPTPRAGLGVGVVNGVLYAIGGDSGGGGFQVVEAYDPGTNTWTTKAPMPTQKSFLGVGVVNGVLYAVGGGSQVVEAYDPGTNTWSTQAPMPTPRTGLGVGVVNGVLYAVGRGVFGPATNEAFTPPNVSFAAFAPKVEIELSHLANHDEFEVKATLTLGTSTNGINPVTEVVIIQVGSFSTTIPAGSFKFKPAKPKKPAQFTFEGIIDGVKLEAKITPLGANSFEFKAEGNGVNLTGTVNPVTVGLTIGNDEGSAAVTATFE